MRSVSSSPFAALRSGVAALSLLLLPACVDNVEPATETTPDPAASTITITTSGGGHAATINATDAAGWQLLDLDAAKAESGDRSSNTKWDLAFQRFQVRVSSGVSGPGSAKVARLADVGFDALTEAPAEGWSVDAADGSDEDDKDDLAIATLGDWYSYDAASHKLSPVKAVFAVQTSEGNYKKVEFQGYYDAAGTSGWITLRFGDLQPPPSVVAPKYVAVDAASSTSYAWIRLADKKVVTGETEAALPDWDLAVQRTGWRTASPIAGGLGGALVLSDTAASSVDTVGFAVDKEMPASGAPGSVAKVANPVLAGWYNYDGTTHAVSPKETAFAVRSRSGGYFRLQIISWSDGKYELDIQPLTAAPVAHTLDLDATSQTAWTYTDLATGTVALAAEATPSSWDLAIRRTVWRTNSGASGTGGGGAVLSELGFDAVDAVPESAAFTTDALAPLAGPPGSGEAPQNAVLSAWYDYNATTHAVTPKPVVFVVQLQDGSHAKLQITGYSAGSYQLRYVYAGPGRTSFAADAK